MDIDKIIEEYKINVNSTEKLILKNLKNSARVFKVNGTNSIENLYIVDTPEGRKIACHPHVVGEELDKLSFSAAKEAAKAINHLLDLKKRKIIFEHILRASLGYKLHDAFKQVLPKIEFSEVCIRPRYVTKSYRNHTTRELEIVYKDFEQMPKNAEILLIKPDTEASGVSGKFSIEAAVKEAEKVGTKITGLVLYGFISMPGLKLLKETADKYGIEVYTFAIGNITGLANNNYDMPLYGIDESYFAKFGKIKKLGSIVDKSTLEEYIPEFIPGCDEPGDWSARQSSLFTGTEYENGNIVEHLQKSIGLIENLRKISNYEKWQDEIAKKELIKLNETLKGYE